MKEEDNDRFQQEKQQKDADGPARDRRSGRDPRDGRDPDPFVASLTVNGPLSYESFREACFENADRVLITAGYVGHAGGTGPVKAVKTAVFRVLPNEDAILFPGQKDGILAAFYRFSETYRKGVVVFQEGLPVLQEDVENAEKNNTDLYRLSSENTVLVEVPKKAALSVVDELLKEGVVSAVSGVITSYPKKELWRLGRKVHIRRP